MVKRLHFEKSVLDSYDILNTKNQLLGTIARRRIGKHMHWVFCPVPFDKLGYLWFTNGQIKEISDKISELYKQRYQ